MESMARDASAVHVRPWRPDHSRNLDGVARAGDNRGLGIDTRERADVISDVHLAFIVSRLPPVSLDCRRSDPWTWRSSP